LSCGDLRHWQADGSMQMLSIQQGVRNDCVSSLLLDHAGALWVGTASGALARIVDGKPETVAEWPGAASVNIWQTEEARCLVSVQRSTYQLDIDAEGHITQRPPIQALEGMRINRVTAAPRGGNW